jgi:hypothetical protein
VVSTGIPVGNPKEPLRLRRGKLNDPVSGRGEIAPGSIIGWLVMRPPILLARSCFCYFSLGPSYFLLRGFLLPSRGPLGEASLGFIFYGFYLLPAAFTFWAFSPFFPRDKVQPHKHFIQMPRLGEWDR